MKKFLLVALVLLIIPTMLFAQDRPGFRRGNVTAYEAFFDSMTVTGPITLTGAIRDTLWVVNEAGTDSLGFYLNSDKWYVYSSAGKSIGIEPNGTGNVSIYSDTTWFFDSTKADSLGIFLDGTDAHIYGSTGLIKINENTEVNSDGSFLARKQITVGDDALNLDGAINFIDASAGTAAITLDGDILKATGAANGYTFDAVIDGTDISGTTIGATTPSTGVFTTVRADGQATITGAYTTVPAKNISRNYLADSTNVYALHQPYVWSGSAWAATNNFGFGYYALQNNTGVGSNGFGDAALQNNTGASSNGFGHAALRNNTGDYSNGFGYAALYNNDGDYNTALGGNSFNTFTEDAGSAQTFADADVTVASNYIYIATHGFGAVNSYLNLKASTTGVLPTGLTAGTIYQFKVIDADTLMSVNNISAAAGGGTHTLTPQAAITNSTAIGYDAEPTAANQIMLGNSSVTEVYGNGDLTISGTTATKASGTTWAEASDERIKDNITTITDGLTKLRSLNPVSFTYTKKWVDSYPSLDTVTVHRGYVADELETTLPTSVGKIAKVYKTIKTTAKDSTGANIEIGEKELQYTDLKTITTHDVNVLAIAAIKELDLLVKTQQVQIELLRTRVYDLEDNAGLPHPDESAFPLIPAAILVMAGASAGVITYLTKRGRVKK